MVELFSWWTAPGEAEALQALVGSHQATHPATRLFNAAVDSGAKARESLQARLARDDPPDLFQANAHDLKAAMERDPGGVLVRNKFLNQFTEKDSSLKLEWLDDLFTSLDLRRTIFPEVLQNLTVDGHIFAMPVNLHRENSVIYNKRIFEENHLQVPHSIEELLALCKKLKAAGIIPVATAKQGWILRIMFHALAMSQMGPDSYHRYFSGEDTTSTLPKLREAIATFGTILREDINSDAGEEGFGWTNAAQAVFNGDAAMFMHGDWAKGYLQALGWVPGQDFDIFAAPGASEVFLYGVDVFALPAGAQNKSGASAFLETISTTQAQVAFNRIKGSSPVRSDVPRNLLDPVGQKVLDDLQNARYRMLVRNRATWEEALVTFFTSHDEDELYRAFVADPPRS